MIRLFITFAAASLLLAGCCSGAITSPKTGSFGDWALTASGEGPMHVLTVNDEAELSVLRTPCENFTRRELSSEEYRILERRMVETVTSPEQDGVGIAGPQVGISRRIVAVMRYDKAGQPFEVYPNIQISEVRGELVPGPEGCLSVPGKRGTVPRYQDITIRYTDPATHRKVKERISGYTAVIFQHECDHLDGILYTDRAEALSGERSPRCKTDQIRLLPYCQER